MKRMLVLSSDCKAGSRSRQPSARANAGYFGVGLSARNTEEPQNKRLRCLQD